MAVGGRSYQRMSILNLLKEDLRMIIWPGLGVKYFPYYIVISSSILLWHSASTTSRDSNSDLAFLFVGLLIICLGIGYLEAIILLAPFNCCSQQSAGEVIRPSYALAGSSLTDRWVTQGAACHPRPPFPKSYLTTRNLSVYINQLLTTRWANSSPFCKSLHSFLILIGGWMLHFQKS